jgi:hypothetical protein
MLVLQNEVKRERTEERGTTDEREERAGRRENLANAFACPGVEDEGDDETVETDDLCSVQVVSAGR